MSAEPVRIAVIADTHDKLPFKLVESIASADEIWHLGDVCGEWVLDELRTNGKPLKVVRGNCDPVAEWPLTLDLTRKGVRIRLVHIPPASGGGHGAPRAHACATAREGRKNGIPESGMHHPSEPGGAALLCLAGDLPERGVPLGIANVLGNDY